MHDLNKKLSSLRNSIRVSLDNSLGYSLWNSLWNSLGSISINDSLDKIVQSTQSVEETNDA